MKAVRLPIFIVTLPIVWLYVVVIIMVSTVYQTGIYFRMWYFLWRHGMSMLMPKSTIIKGQRHQLKLGLALATSDCLEYLVGGMRYKQIFV
jgi:hypothetical protein